MFEELLGDYEPKGKTIQGVGKFIAMGLDDPFHITTVTGFAVYGIGKMIEKRSNYGIRRAMLDIANIKREMRELSLDLATLKLL
ncbi:hypothetical protein DFR86_08005 [Acidianus sulfidivorans JP7]|uniref:Uncharacterized protein n=1 Tax=Acidianus sulfidivorans JP7 TaxID=619593 RepID=A0A2U9IN93_9CREN|nr:hypothetical protein [Acidianus sulfidivorans]AWR97498.1 hypothetical protein DFR86_08005 [Acidianus sulfidivorans JP7]